MKKITTLLAILAMISTELFAQEKPAEAANSAQAIADKLSNPVANLISVPLQNNLDYGIGPYHGSKYTINFQPVVPVKLSSSLNLITRLVLPIIDQRDITGEGTRQTGLSDATLTGFFAPSNSKGGVMWGAGPAILIPTGTNEFLTTKKWGAGPSLLLLRQANSLTYGFLVNQIWSFAGDKNRSDVNQMFLQPFFAKNFKSGAGLGLNAEITSNWEAQTTTAFINPTISGVTKLGSQMVSLVVGPRIPVAAPKDGRADFGFRGALTFVFPQ